MNIYYLQDKVCIDLYVTEGLILKFKKTNQRRTFYEREKCFV